MHYGFRIRNLVLAVFGAIFILVMVDCLEPEDSVTNQKQTVQVTPTPLPEIKPGPYYKTCQDAPVPMRIGEPGYRVQLDRDNDGIACE